MKNLWLEIRCAVAYIKGYTMGYYQAAYSTALALYNKDHSRRNNTKINKTKL